MMKQVALSSFLFAGGFAFSISANAQDGPAQDNLIDGERFPDGYTPMDIKNGVYPRRYAPNTERLGP